MERTFYLDEKGVVKQDPECATVQYHAERESVKVDLNIAVTLFHFGLGLEEASNEIGEDKLSVSFIINASTMHVIGGDMEELCVTRAFFSLTDITEWLLGYWEGDIWSGIFASKSFEEGTSFRKDLREAMLELSKKCKFLDFELREGKRKRETLLTEFNKNKTNETT
ncbi:MAG: hypothetical protein WCV58_03760 [Patescibacteria group bacterium]|jgi:hypothetical protein